ncbi:MAG: hypothetical protein QOF24_424 [Verrucomicrobiota bacterium]|jgi:2-polyprenyl-3-methyl-5-hydroxy-6-metoxy-1,4-benzoquinol methylase
MRSISYLILSLKKLALGQGRSCPSCGSPKAEGPTEDRKWIVTTLRRCARCKILYRAPATTKEQNDAIYQKEYREGFTTEMPDEADLARLIQSGFKNCPCDYTTYLEVLRGLHGRLRATLYDFGCSWGYGAYQLKAAGYDVVGYEIGAERAQFAATKLGVRLRTPDEVEDSSVDIFFSAHVLEHVPSVEATIKTATRLLRPGGLFVCFTPNGSLERRAADPNGWHHAWGFVHPQLLDRVWIEARREEFVVADTGPYDIGAITRGRTPGKWQGSELMFSFRKGAS